MTKTYRPVTPSQLADELIDAQCNVMSAMAMDQNTANAHATYLAERNLQRPTVCMRRYWRLVGGMRSSTRADSESYRFVVA